MTAPDNPGLFARVHLLVRHWIAPWMGVLAFLVGSGCATPNDRSSTWNLTPLSGKQIQWKPAPTTKAVVFLFLAVECPISNRALPQLSRLERQLAPSVDFIWVYPNVSEDESAIRKHRAAFQLSPEAYRDPKLRLAKSLKATVTPEAVVVTPDGRLIYRGRVNDQYTGLGKGRPQPTREDLADALNGYLSGQPPSGIVTRAVGCSIEDLP